MYAHSFFATSVRGRALLPVTVARVALGVSGAMNAADGFLFVFVVFVAIVFCLNGLCFKIYIANIRHFQVQNTIVNNIS
jgi:hypothetical protein